MKGECLNKPDAEKELMNWVHSGNYVTSKSGLLAVWSCCGERNKESVGCRNYKDYKEHNNIFRLLKSNQNAGFARSRKRSKKRKMKSNRRVKY